jgi:hypothetical protein
MTSRPRGTRRTSATCAALLVSLGLLACASKAKKPMTPDDDNSKAFAELEKNDKDPAPMSFDAGAAAATDKPKGPVYPAPFTAEQIRDATKNGRTYRYKVEVPDQPAHEYTITFRKVDQAGAEVYSGAGTPKRMGWNILQSQAEFPKDKVKTHDEKLKTPAGKFECIVYDVAGENDEVWTYYFAKKLPGAPVFFYCERHGKRLRTTTLVEHVAGR